MWQSNRQYISLHFIFLLQFLDHLSPVNNTIKVLLLYFTQGTSTILNLISVLAETFYPGFITFYAYAPCIYIMYFYGLLKNTALK
jgi:hypothetical protein